MHSELSHTRFARELAEFALSLERLGERSATARATFKVSPARVTAAKGMPRVTTFSRSLPASEGRQQQGCPGSILRLCGDTTPKVTAGRRPKPGSQKQAKQADRPVGLGPETLVLVRPFGFDKIDELRLSLQPESDATRVVEHDFISMGIGMRIRCTPSFRVVSNQETFTKWHAYLADAPEDKFSVAAEKLLALATMTKGSPKSQTGLGKLQEIYCGQYWWRRFYLTHRIFTTDGGRKNLSHARSWTTAIRSAS